LRSTISTGDGRLAEGPYKSNTRPEKPAFRVRGRLQLLTQFFPPETNAGAKRIGPMARALQGRYDVLVVAPRPGYPSPADYKGFPVARHDTGLPFEVRRSAPFHPHKGSLALRTLREQVMALRLALRALSGRADVVVASSPSIFLGPAGLLIARLKGARFVWDVRDLTWGYAREVTGTSRATALAARALEWYMLVALRCADLVVGASAGITAALVRDGIEPGRAITVPNGISSEVLDEVSQVAYEKVEKRRPIVAYAGVVGYNQGLCTLVEAARLLPGVDFVLAGDGPELPLLKEKARRFGIENVTFKGYLDREGLLEVYRESDILVAHVRSTPTIDATMVPVKLFEYMAAGRPIVYAGRGIAADLLREIGCAETVPPEDPRAIRDAVAGLLADPRRMRELGERGAERAKLDFRRERIMEELARELEHRFGEPAPGGYRSQSKPGRTTGEIRA
jgi:glycosyltransferase involved in cell wall biosynthesis